MAINMYNIKKWFLMLTGKSSLHVNQGIGKYYSKNEVKGYYNDLTEKITKYPPKTVELPTYTLPNGEKIHFSIGIFQYGLAAYDLFLTTKDKKMLKIFKKCVDWCCSNQQLDGSWITFKDNENPYSSMAQGEGISLLIRAYVHYKDKKYFVACRKAVKFMMKSIDENGVTKYENSDIYLQEYPLQPTVLNGWIFSVFGLYDYLLVDKDKNILKFYNQTINTLKKTVEYYDNGFWSKYNLSKMLASPFYHNLHINLLQVLSDITGEDIFSVYAKKWRKYAKNPLFNIKAFVIKAMQKIRE